jgi:coenzyme F420 hydrogenase subunit beta
MKTEDTQLSKQIKAVVESDNCSGCGLCASLFQGVSMALSDDGYMRPAISPTEVMGNQRDAAGVFARACPGRLVAAPRVEQGAKVHPIFGRYVGVWEGWSTDEKVRLAGSSGGVLTAIAGYVSDRAGAPARMVAMDADRPSRTVPVTIMSREEALQAAGSRYAPVSVAADLDAGLSSITGKPCEIAGVRASGIDRDGPLLLSFFCAGTPSQFATERLIQQLGHDVDSVTQIRYRGDGWPGTFSVSSENLPTGRKSYEASWGEVLGKRLQGRCKICVDGTGESADIAVGDYWLADDSGYPSFEDQDGRSVVIARTHRGAKVLEDCLTDGLIELNPISLDSVARIQPLQVKRRTTLAGRLLGKRLIGLTVPRYPGYSLISFLLRNPGANLRAAAGTVRRSLRNRI